MGQNTPNYQELVWYYGQPKQTYGPTGETLPYQYYNYPQPNWQLPFLATLDMPDLSKLINDPIQHAPYCPAIPVKLPSGIPKNHVMTFHLWCSSNSLMDDSNHLSLFQRTLTDTTAKWYIELPQHSFVDFSSLEIVFLTHFQLPISYETGMDILTSLHQNTSTHISNHIHEWRRWWRLIKALIPYQLLVDWFTNSLFPPITRDVAMGGVVTKEQAIIRA